MNPERAKYLKEMEIGGILFCSLYAILAGKLYELSGKGLIGVLFGSVNNSPWECIKPLLLSYLLWGILEALSLRARNRQRRIYGYVSDITLHLYGGIAAAVLLRA